MNAVTSRIKWAQFRSHLAKPWRTALGINPYSFSQYVLDRSARNREAIASRQRTSNGERIAALEPSVSQRQPQKRAIERWEGEGGKTQVKAPRAD